MTQMNQPGTISCPHCGQTYTIAAEQWPLYVGRSISCTKCGQMFAVSGGQPAGATPAPSVPPQAPVPNYQTPGGFPQQGYAPQPQKQGMSGCAIAAIIGGVVCVLLIGCGFGLFAIMTPALHRVRDEALKAKCMANMKNIGNSLAMYAAANGGKYPDSMTTLVRSSQVMPMELICPATSDMPLTTSVGSITDADLNGHDSYVYVGGGHDSSAGADVVLLYETSGNHADKGMNVLYGDLHVAWVPQAAAQQIISQNPSTHNGH